MRIHAAALLALLSVGLVPFGAGNVIMPDEGLYSAQAALLAGGSWDGSRPAADLDPDGSRDALKPEVVKGDRHIPYVRHPLYPLLLAPAYRLLGTRGLMSVSVVGAWLAAVTGAVIARRLRPGSTIPALWFGGAASPLVFDAHLVAAHSLAAAAAGAMLLAADSARTGSRRRLLTLALTAAALVLLRSEGTVLAAATGAAVGIASLRRRGRTVHRRTLAISVTILTTVATSTVIESALGRLWSDGQDAGNLFSRSSDALSGAWHDLIQPWEYDPRDPGAAASIVVMVAVVGAGMASRFHRRLPLLPIALSLVGAAAGLVRLVQADTLVPGLIAACPVVAMGIIGLDRRSLDDRRVVVLGAIAVITACGIAATAYGIGGATQWGGRFYHLLLPALVALATIGFADLLRRFSPRQARVVNIAIVVVALTATMLLVSAQSTWRGVQEANRAFVERAAGAVTTEPDPLIVVSTLTDLGISRAFWAEIDAGRPVLANQLGEIHALLRDVDRAGRRTVVLATDVDAGLARYILDPTLRELDWTLRDVTEPRTSLNVMVIERN